MVPAQGHKTRETPARTTTQGVQIAVGFLGPFSLLLQEGQTVWTSGHYRARISGATPPLLGGTPPVAFLLCTAGGVECHTSLWPAGTIARILSDC